VEKCWRIRYTAFCECRITNQEGWNRNRQAWAVQSRIAMHLTPREIEKLLVATAADLARKRLARGLKLNHPESVALITAEVLEGIRDGKSVSELMEYGATILHR
jgi:hypothetical protein